MKTSILSNLRSLLDELSESVLVLSHRNTDFDGVASALLVYFYLKNSLNRDQVFLAFPEGIARPVQDFLSKLNVNLRDVVKYFESSSQVECRIHNVIVLDVSSMVQLGDFSKIVEFADNVVLIDHHAVHDIKTRGYLHVFSNPDATSTCEILLAHFDDYSKFTPDWFSALALAAIIVDSKKFSRATYVTFEVCSKLIQNLHTTYENVIQTLFQRTMPFDEKMARIKGMLRTEAYRFDDKILCVSHVSAHEASLARLLLDAGCDIVIIVSEHDEEFRIIARTKLDNISMAEFCRKMCERYGGQGGGHVKAGAAAIKKQEKLTLRKLARESIKVMSQIIGKKLKRVKP